MPTTTEIAIRRAVRSDYNEACSLLNLLDEFHREQAPWLFKKPDSPQEPNHFFDQLLDSDASAVFVADAGQLVGIGYGFMRTAPQLPMFISQRWGVLDGLVVHPAWRRQRIGERLMYAIEGWALQHEASWVELNVYEFNPNARQFYESLGYLPMSTKLRKPRPDDV